MVSKEARNEWIAEEYRRAYAAKPQTEEERAWAEYGLRRLGEV